MEPTTVQREADIAIEDSQREEIQTALEMDDANEKALAMMRDDAENADKPEEEEEEEQEDDEEERSLFNLVDAGTPIPAHLEAEMLKDGVKKIPEVILKFQRGLFYLGRKVFVQVYGRPVRDNTKSGLYIEISQQKDKTASSNSSRIILTYDQWVKLMYYKKTIARCIQHVKNERMVDERKCLGRDYYASVTYPYQIVSLRKWYRGEDTGLLLPSKFTGIPLRFPEYERLLQLDPFMMNLAEELELEEDENQVCARTKKRKADEGTCPPEFQRVLTDVEHLKKRLIRRNKLTEEAKQKMLKMELRIKSTIRPRVPTDVKHAQTDESALEPHQSPDVQNPKQLKSELPDEAKRMNSSESDVKPGQSDGGSDLEILVVQDPQQDDDDEDVDDDILDLSVEGDGRDRGGKSFIDWEASCAQ